MLAEVCGIVEGIIVINSRVLRKKNNKLKQKPGYFSAFFFSSFFLRVFFPLHIFNLFKVTDSSFASLAFFSYYAAIFVWSNRVVLQ